MVLSGRLQMLADMVTPGSVLADVGCDHGFLSIYLVQAGGCPRAVAIPLAQIPQQHWMGRLQEQPAEPVRQLLPAPGRFPVFRGKAAGCGRAIAADYQEEYNGTIAVAAVNGKIRELFKISYASSMSVSSLRIPARASSARRESAAPRDDSTCRRCSPSRSWGSSVPFSAGQVMFWSRRTRFLRRASIILP